MIHYDKLVRDRIPQIIEEDGKDFSVRKLEDDEYRLALIDKLQEEVDEFMEEPQVEELADVLEVLHALADTFDVPFDELDDLRERKREERGAFNDQLLLEWVDDDS